MSDTVAVALITAGSTLAALFVTQLFHWLRQKQAQEESYRLKLYDKRLEVYQKAYAWLLRLHEVYADLLRAEDNRLTEAMIARGNNLSDCGQEARQWWIDNRYYLDPASQGQFVDYINHLVGSHPSKQDAIALLSRVITTVDDGIGMKHIQAKEVTKLHDQ